MARWLACAAGLALPLAAGALGVAGAVVTTPQVRAELVAQGLAALERDGFALQGRYTPDAAGTEWVARRLLARMHSYSRRSRRQTVQPATARDFMYEIPSHASARLPK